MCYTAIAMLATFALWRSGLLAQAYRGVQVGKKSGAMDFSEKRICAYEKCEKEFTTNRPNKKYHSKTCQFKAWEDKHPRSSELGDNHKKILTLVIDRLKNDVTVQDRMMLSDILKGLL